MMRRQNERRELTCVALDDMGRGVCRDQEMTFFIDGLLPSEKCLAEITYQRKNLGFGRIFKLLTTSPDRVAPTCPGYPYCGCSLTHLAYSARLEYKQSMIHNLIHKFAGLDIPVLPTIPCPELKGYRNKVQKPVGGKRGDLILGFYKPMSHELSPCVACESESPLSQRISQALLPILNQAGYEPYDEDRGTGQLRHVLIKTSRAFDEALVTIVSADPQIEHLALVGEKLHEAVPQVKGLILNINTARTNVILGVRERLVWGEPKIRERVLGKEFTISSKSFFQTNPVLLDTLYSTAIECAQLTGTERVLDAYCGTGTIGLCLADSCRNVTGVESEVSSFQDARENARINGIRNAFFRNEDCTEFMRLTKAKFEVVVLDPPRKGTTPQFIHALERIAPQRVVYISCDPSTLARDLKLLTASYRVESVQGVDMFPNTHHVETVCSLVRK